MPAPLGALLAITAILGVAWALASPAWQAPDENSHFAYTQSIAERFDLPGDPARQRQSTEQTAAAEATEADQVAAILEGRPPWSNAAERGWEALDFTAAQRADGGGVNPAAANPPLYYVSVAPAYLVAGGDVFDRLYAARLAGVLWLLVTVTMTWLLAGELLGRRRPLQLAAAAIAGLTPMMTFVSASVSPDPMLYAVWTTALWLGVRILKRGLTPARAGALGAAVAAAILVKATSYVLVPAALVVLAVGTVRAFRAGQARRAALSTAVMGAALALPLAVWWVVARSAERGAAEQVAGTNTQFGLEKLRQFVSYVWQFYLPKLPFMNELPKAAEEATLWDAWVRGGFGRFGWLEVTLPDWVYAIVLAAGLAVLAGLVVLAVRARRRLDLPVLAFLLVTCGALLVGLHWTDFHFILTGSQFMQGRYLLPLVGVAGVAVATVIGALPARWRSPAVGVLLAGLLVTQLLSLATTLTRFYA